MKFYSSIDKWIIPESAFAESFREMARDGINGNEGVALWLGKRLNAQSQVTHIIKLRGPGIIKHADLLIIKPELISEITDLTIEFNVALVGQIHSHGEHHGTDLSPTDHKFGIRVPYYLSIVAPNYGLGNNTHISDCGVHIFEPKIGYRRLSKTEIIERVQIVPAQEVSHLTVGE